MGLFNLPGKIDPAFGIGKYTFLLCPDCRRQKYMCVLAGFHVGIRILNHQTLQLLQSFAYARRIRHRGHGIGCNQPQAFDFSGFNCGENIGFS